MAGRPDVGGATAAPNRPNASDNLGAFAKVPRIKVRSCIAHTATESATFAKSRKLSILDEIAATFACGKRIELCGFGTFSVKVWEARTCRNPRAGAPIPIPKKAFPDSRREGNEGETQSALRFTLKVHFRLTSQRESANVYLFSS